MNFLQILKLYAMLLFFSLALVSQAQSDYLYFDNYHLENGLSSEYVFSVFQDSEGWIWIGTGKGIEKFDGLNFKYYNFTDSNAVSDNYVAQDFLETSGNQLLVSTSIGLAVYNRSKDVFEHFSFNDSINLHGLSFRDLDEDENGNLWGISGLGICKINLSDHKIDFIEKASATVSNYMRKVYYSKNNLWIAAVDGLKKYVVSSDSMIAYGSLHPKLNDDILEITSDNNGDLWVGTNSYGIVVIDDANLQFKNIIPEKGNIRSLKIHSIYQDKLGNYWVGTRGGIYTYDISLNQLAHYKHKIQDSHSLVHSSTVSIIQDIKGDMWFGTRGGLSNMVVEKQMFRNYHAFINTNQYLNDEEVYSILEKDHELWLGTERGGINIINKATGTVRFLTQKDGLGTNGIKAIKSFDKRFVYIGTYQGGFSIYDVITGEIETFLHDKNNANSIADNEVWDIEADDKGQIWLATSSGLDMFNPLTRKFTHFNGLDNQKASVSWIAFDDENDLWIAADKLLIYRPGVGIIKTINQFGRNLFVDSAGNYWLLTENLGLILYDKYAGPIRIYDKSKGLADNRTYCMLEDPNRGFWISTSNGLSYLNKESGKFENYYNYNGIPGNKFNYEAAEMGADGEFYFGGINGLTAIQPSNILENNYVPPVYITDIKINNQSVKNNEIEGVVIAENNIEIPYKYKLITFEFIALNYSNSIKNKYKYKLEGFDDDWAEADLTEVTYTNLNPGKYKFVVIASNDKGIWNETGASKQFTINPPFYRTIWFMTIFSMLILSVVLLVFNFIFKKREEIKSIEMEKVQAQKLHELDSYKLKLFTNISHEIKTPLTLIISPLQKLNRLKLTNPELKESLQMMEKNATHLMDMITQLLDYRKFQEGKLKIDQNRGDIVRFCHRIFLSFKDLMQEHNLSYRFNSVQSKIMTKFDDDKLTKILNNLLSNAIKYNRPGGSVTLNISMIIERDASDFTNEKHFIKLEVKDTGVGIDNKDVGNIFKRFYIKHTNSEINSTGIGLAFTKELVELLQGKIFVESKVGVGTLFTVLLPFTEPMEDTLESPHTEILNSKEFIDTDEFKKEQEYKKVLLLVEDNTDILKFIKNHFSNRFIVLTASNGNDGLELAISAIPDIIISDVMIPEINGIELCKKIKSDLKTSHIPLVLLTALSSKESEKEGLRCRADDYMTKPFDIEILETKIDNLLLMQKSMQEKYNKQLLLQPKHVEVKSREEKFIQKTITIIENHLSNPDFGVNELAAEMAVSRMQLYRKITALTNMGVKELLNDIRLKRAAQILSEKKMSIAEVAYEVGFNELSYFSKCFKKQFGLSPSTYNAQKIKSKK